ncbi:hypothetical protein ACFQ07_12080, partial [Actinomadura adrarensis]
AVMAFPGTANAQVQPLTVEYPFTGTSHIAGVNDDLELGPGTMRASLNLQTGDATADVELPPVQGEFDAIGFIPTTVTTTFIEEGQSTAFVDPRGGATTAWSNMTIQLSNLKVLGIPLLIGSHCKTETPVQLTLNSQPGWSVLTGGTLAGTYSIPDFENCLLNTWLINSMIPGDGNTITLNLSTPTVIPPG